MTADELKKIAAKIAKCLALAASDNPAEAESAKRQADALMKKYNLTSGDVAAADFHEEKVDTKSIYLPAVYLSQLSNLIATAFGCESVISSGVNYGIIRRNAMIRFMGLGIKPELAAYTYDVLSRQIKRDRTRFTDSLNAKIKRATKIRRADLFCQAWVEGISRQVLEFAGTEHERNAIAAYKEQRFGGKLQADDRAGAASKHSHDWKSSEAGLQAAKDVSLHKPVQGKRGALLGKSS